MEEKSQPGRMHDSSEEHKADNFGKSVDQASVYIQKIVQAQIASLESQLLAVTHNPNEANQLDMHGSLDSQIVFSLSEDEQILLLQRQREALEQVRTLQMENEELKRKIKAQQEINERLEKKKTEIYDQILDLQPQENISDQQLLRLEGGDSYFENKYASNDELQTSETVAQWPSNHDNKLQIKYYEYDLSVSESPLQFYVDLNNEGLLFNRLVLVESNFTLQEWNKFVNFMKHLFTQIVKRVRIWDAGLCSDDTKLKSNEIPKLLEKSLMRLFRAIETRSGLLELDIQHVNLGALAMKGLIRVLTTVNHLKRLTFISEATDPSEMQLMAEGMSSNEGIQLESLVFYGLNLGLFETSRALAHFLGRQRRLKVVRLQDCSLEGKALFALVTQLRKSCSIQTLQKLFLSLNTFDTHESVITLCGFVKDAIKLKYLCTFFTGVIIKWTPTNKDTNEAASSDIIAIGEKKNDELFRLQR